MSDLKKLRHDALAACKDEDELNEMLGYLDFLREVASINMMGAAKYLRNEFEFERPELASHVLMYWMKSFGDEDR